RTAPMLNREVVTYLTDTFPHENGIEGFIRVYGSVRPRGSVAAQLVIVSNRAVIVNSVLKAKELLLKTGGRHHHRCWKGEPLERAGCKDAIRPGMAPGRDQAFVTGRKAPTY